MAKQLLAFLLSLALLLLFATDAEGQTHLVSKTEIVGDFDGNSYTLLTELEGYIFIRTDQEGNVVWNCPLNVFSSDSIQFITSQSRFIVAGITNINKKNGKIHHNPGDYDYWLVPISDLTDGFLIKPNPTLGKVFVTVNQDSKIHFFRMYNPLGSIILSFQNTGASQFELDLGTQKSGTYLLEGIDEKGFSIQTSKIIKQ